MTATLDGVAKKKEVEQSAEQHAAVELVRLAREQDLWLTGPDGLLKQLTGVGTGTSVTAPGTRRCSQDLAAHPGNRGPQPGESQRPARQR
jgi:hypothetical protein